MPAPEGIARISPIRLLVLSSTYPRHAADSEPRFVHELARRLVGRFEVSALVPSAPGLVAKERMDGVAVHRFRYAPGRLERLAYDGGIVPKLRRNPWLRLLVPFFVVGQIVGTLRALRRLDPQVIHAHWLLPQGATALIALALSRKRVPLVLTSHGADLFTFARGPLRHLLAWVVRRAAAVTVVGRHMVPVIHGLPHCADVEVATIPMGTDVEKLFVPDATAVRERNTLLFVGRLVEKKGVDDLLRALRLVRDQGCDATLTVVGNGPLRAELEQLATRLGLQEYARFVGAVPQSELPALYRRAAAFVAPFRVARDDDQEGLGLVMVEALACGCPVISTRVPAIEAEFAHLGPLLVEPGSPAALADAIARVLVDGSSLAPGADVRPKILAQFGWSAITEAYAALLTAHDGALLDSAAPPPGGASGAGY
jgi:glycosyltransferase involved in cell wall biosynthesis